MASKKKNTERQYRIMGDILATRMKEKGYSIAALADKMGVSVSTVSRWLDNKKAYLKNIKELADLLGTKPGSLAVGLGSGGDRVQVVIKVSWPSDIPMTDERLQNFIRSLQDFSTFGSGTDYIVAQEVTEED